MSSTKILASETAEDDANAAALAAKDAVIADLQAQLAATGTQLTDALAAEAVDAQAVADAQATLDAQAADVQRADRSPHAAFPAPAPAPASGS